MKREIRELARSLVRFGLMVTLCCVTQCALNVSRAEEPEPADARKVIAKVNGQPIYEDQLKPTLERNLKSLLKRGGGKQNPQLVKRLQIRLLHKLIGDMLVDQESKKRTVENMEEKVDQRIKDLEKKYGPGQGMEKYLEVRRITMEDLRKSLRVRVRIDEYLKEEGVLEPEIPEERIREMYDADPKSFSTTSTVSASHILIAVDPHAGLEQKQKAREKAEQIRQEILGGKDFAEMAKEHSDCSTASEGGNLGRVRRRYMPAAFDEAAFSLEKDAFSEVVETRHGYHIIKVADKELARVVPYEDMRAFLKKYLQDEESKTKLALHITELKKKSEIDILLK